MSKKAFGFILILSVVGTYVIAILDIWINKSKNIAGLPLGFSSLGSFLGGSTDYLMLVLDIVFWFVITWGIWKMFKIVFRK